MVSVLLTATTRFRHTLSLIQLPNKILQQIPLVKLTSLNAFRQTCKGEDSAAFVMLAGLHLIVVCQSALPFALMGSVLGLIPAIALRDGQDQYAQKESALLVCMEYVLLLRLVNVSMGILALIVVPLSQILLAKMAGLQTVWIHVRVRTIGQVEYVMCHPVQLAVEMGIV